MKATRHLSLLLGLALAAAAPATASTIAVSVTSDNSVCRINGGIGACTENSGDYDSGVGWDYAGGTSSNLVGIGSTATSLAINGMAAIDGGNDRTVTGDLSFNITLAVDVDGAAVNWTVDLTQSVLGLFAFRGDGTATAVGNQDDGSASISTILTNVGGNNYNFAASPSGRTADCSNNCETSTQFSGARGDSGIISGTGDQNISVNISFDLNAMTNAGCSGFICSSVSGGEEAAVLFGKQDLMDQAVDNYSTWSRSLGPDGYNSTWTLNVLNIPEPTTGLLVGLGLTGLAFQARRRD